MQYFGDPLIGPGIGYLALTIARANSRYEKCYLAPFLFVEGIAKWKVHKLFFSRVLFYVIPPGVFFGGVFTENGRSSLKYHWIDEEEELSKDQIFDTARDGEGEREHSKRNPIYREPNGRREPPWSRGERPQSTRWLGGGLQYRREEDDGVPVGVPPRSQCERKFASKVPRLCLFSRTSSNGCLKFRSLWKWCLFVIVIIYLGIFRFIFYCDIEFFSSLLPISSSN